MKKQVKEAFKKLGYKIETYSALNQKIFGSRVPSLNEFTVDEANETIHLHTLDLELNLKEHAFFLKQIWLAKDLQKILNAKFNLKENIIYTTFDDITIALQTIHDVHILHEVFVRDCYNYISEEEFVAIDIGMNVGFASLFFSRNKYCKHVFSFEPFRETYKQALFNISLNKHGSKICPNNFGLAATERSLETDYIADYRGGLGINGLPEFIKTRENVSRTTIQLHDAVKELSPVINEHKGKYKIILKIDCEGAEYEILKNLNASGLLHDASIIMIEWHTQGPADLHNDLLSAGFQIFSFNSSHKSIGMLYAFKK